MGKINSLGTDAGLHSYTTLKYVVTTNGFIFNLWLQAKHAPYENRVPEITDPAYSLRLMVKKRDILFILKSFELQIRGASHD